MKKQLTLPEIQEVLRVVKPDLAKQYHVREIGVFGSYVRGQQTKRSDVDILVDFDQTISAFSYVRLKAELTERLGQKVDLVAKKALKPRIGKRILDEVVYL